MTEKMTACNTVRGSFQVETPLELTPRVARLRQRHIEEYAAHPWIDVERDILFTESMKKTEPEDTQIRFGKAFKHILENKSVTIWDDELIVGCINSKDKEVSTAIYPELGTYWILDELDHLNDRQFDPYRIDEETKRVIREELLPYWSGKSLKEKCMARISEEERELNREMLLTFEVITENYLGHRNQSWSMIFGKGVGGITQMARDRLETLDPTIYTNVKKRNFIKGLILLGEGISHFIERHAEEARRQAAVVSDQERAAELTEIARVCDAIAYEPPKTFHEAVQLFYFMHMMCYITEKGFGNSPGMLDDVLYPFYKKDLEEGRITREQAVELMECAWIKLANNVQLSSEASARFYSGYMPFTVISIGGLHKDGTDVTNDMSYIMLEAYKNVRTHQPLLDAAFHKDTPDEFWKACAEVIRLGTGIPCMVNVDAAIPHNMFLGATLEDARYSTGQGCVYPLLYDGMRQMTDTGMFNFSYAMELALNDGRSRLTGKQISIHTGDPRFFRSFEDVWTAFERQIEHLVREQVIVSSIFMRVHEEEFPELLDSFCSDGCIEKALRSKDPEGGGCKYPFMIVTPGMGLGDVADSMMVLKKLVFEDKRISMDELLRALDANWEGYEKLRQICLNDVPKFGQDDEEADAMTLRVDNLFAFEHYKYRHADGSYRYYNSYASTSGNTPMGDTVGALPSGRIASTPLSDNNSPAHGVAECNGPTAIFNSVAHGMAPDQQARGLLNMKLTADTFRNEGAIDRFVSMVKTYFQNGGFHVQFNVVNNEVLKDAQKHPENYKDLLVRVAGYSGYFTSLSKECQDDLIGRGEHAM